MKVIKRNGSSVPYSEQKIVQAILAANSDVASEYHIDIHSAQKIAGKISTKLSGSPTVEDIQDLVEMSLMEGGFYELAKAYMIFRYERALVRKANSTDDTILSLLRNEAEELDRENSNKNTKLGSTERDYIAGIVSRDLSERCLLDADIVQAHRKGEIHFHDLDYFIQPIPNCCLVNIGDQLLNGTAINGKLIESPKTFRVACTVMTQIIANIASNQYGGQSVDISHLGVFLHRSKEKYRQKLLDAGIDKSSEEFKRMLDILLKDEIAAGVQTIQYQINTLMTTNGQAPFVTLFLNLKADDEYIEENAMIIQEILEQRIEGIKNEVGISTTPPFPKLVYVLDEHNCLKGGKYDYLTKLAVKCSAKRMYPDYISAKIMRKNYEGNVFSPMGCRSFLSPWKDENGEYKFEGRFNQGVVSINLPQIAILAKGNEDKFWEILEKRLSIAFKALLRRHQALEKSVSDISPVHWQCGGISRLNKGEKITKLLHNGYSTLSLGYIGVYEMTKVMKGVSHTDPEGKEFALKVMHYLANTCKRWKESTGLGFALYGTPAESLCYRFAKIDKQRFGDIEDITDKGYYTNSYHVDVREKIDAFNKLKFESEFQNISLGGAISYIEVPNLQCNLLALEDIVRFIYDNIQYAEINTKSDVCQKCGFTGEILLDDKLQWRCPNCGNTDKSTLNVVRRTCGYLGENFWNEGKTKEISKRVLHL